ncbi:MAG: DDE-type integrase/transposase/recombinase [Phycisphaerales bacterium]|nr:DDE-type integrase/transposase/recombinase [Phycisphaerales bacterium]
MALAARQLPASATDDWLRVDDAAALTNESERTWQFKAQSEARAARDGKRTSLAVKRTPGGGGKPVWFVHRCIDPRLSKFPTRDAREDRERVALIARYPQHKVEQAWTKARWLQCWRDECARRRGAEITEAELAERIIVEARRVEGDDYPISFRTLQAWRTAYDAKGDDGRIRGVEGLIDNRGGESGGGGAHESRSADAVEYFYSLYRCQNRLTVRTCHDATLRKARERGWTWPKSYSATRKWLAVYDDLSLTALCRLGRDAWNRRYMPFMELDYTLIEPGDLFVCDHTQCDFWVEHHGEQMRPWLTAIQDGRSRCIVGWHLGVAPHQDTILSAMRGAFRWAVPEHLRIDNGKDFTSKLLTGVTKHERDALRRELGGDWRRVLERNSKLAECVDPRFKGVVHELGIELIYARPYAAWSKGTIERFFGTFEDQCGKTFATYCGNSTMTRPECLETIRRGYTKEQKRSLRKRYGKDWKRVAVLRLVDKIAVPTLQEAREVVGEWIEVYHRKQHLGDGMEGRSPLAVWHTATTLHKADDQSLLILLEARGVYCVGPNGVRFRVGNCTLGYGAKCAALNPLRGRDVFITLNPDDLSCCHAWTPDESNRRYIGRLESNDRISPKASIDDLRDASATNERRRKGARKAAREAPATTRNVAAELRAQNRQRLAELQATGTDGAPRVVNVKPVRTTFEGVSMPVQTAVHGDAEQFRIGELSAASRALGYQFNQSSATDRDDAKDGKDADRPTRADLMGLLTGRRHERTNE